MKKLLLATLTLSLLLFTNHAFATPVVDGAIGAGEWTTSLLLNALDPHEAAIPDNYNIRRIAMFEETGGTGNGMYLLVELFGIPTFLSLDETTPPSPVFYRIAFDMNQDGDFADSVDRTLDYRATGFTVYDGLASVIAGTTATSMGSVVELFVSPTMYTASDFNGFALLDNGGAPPDDRLPDTSTFTNVPEPSSMLLLGTGLMGLIGGAFRRKFAA